MLYLISWHSNTTHVFRILDFTIFLGHNSVNSINCCSWKNTSFSNNGCCSISDKHSLISNNPYSISNNYCSISNNHCSISNNRCWISNNRCSVSNCHFLCVPLHDPHFWLLHFYMHRISISHLFPHFITHSFFCVSVPVCVSEHLPYRFTYYKRRYLHTYIYVTSSRLWMLEELIK